MRFNSISRPNVGSYISAGRASGDSSANILNAIVESRPDYPGMIQTYQDAESAKRQALIKAETDAIKGIISANAKRTVGKNRVDIAAADARAERRSRFAGYLGALGSQVAEDVADAFKPKKKPIVEKTADPNADGSTIKFIEEQLEELRREREELGDPKERPTAPTAPTMPELPGSGPNEVEQTQTQGSPEVSTPPVQKMSFKPGAIPTKAQLMPALSSQEVYSIFKQAGATDQQASVFTKISLKESANIPNNNTITSGLVNRAGETSYGIAQINMFDTQDPIEHERRKRLFGISHSTDLFDPLTNARAALKLHAEQGYGAWATFDPSML